MCTVILMRCSVLVQHVCDAVHLSCFKYYQSIIWITACGSNDDGYSGVEIFF